jgi:hypothetical protein
VFTRLRNVTTVGVVAVLASASTVLAPPAAQAAAYPKQCSTGRVVCIDKTTKSVDWLVDGSLRLTLDARFGSKGTPTRDGFFKVYRKSEKHVSRLYDSPMPYALFFDGGQAVHYSPDFKRNGYDGASRGCVNTRDRGLMKELFDAVRLGDKVYVYSSKPGQHPSSQTDGPKGYYDPENPWY